VVLPLDEPPTRGKRTGNKMRFPLFRSPVLSAAEMHLLFTVAWVTHRRCLINARADWATSGLQLWRFKASGRGRPMAYARLTSRTRVFGDALFRAPPPANPPQVSQSAYPFLSTAYRQGQLLYGALAKTDRLHSGTSLVLTWC
jgi:hypothetical protein